jgi:hypothetical protein
MTIKRHAITALAALVLAVLGAALLARLQGDAPHGSDAGGVWALLAAWPRGR